MATRLSPEPALRRIERSCAEAGTASQLFAGCSRVLHDVVPHDGATWFGADPVTLLAASPVRIEALESAQCDPFWHLEFHVQDFAQYVDLARSTQPVAALQLSLDGRPGRSARYRELMKPFGYDDELRGVLRAGPSTWGFVGLYRERGRPHFDAEEVEVMSRAAPVIGAALRSHVRAQSPWPGSCSRAPGLVLFDGSSDVLSANAEAMHWLSELVVSPERAAPPPDGHAPFASVEELLSADHLPRHIHGPLYALVERSRAVALGIDGRAARLRLRDRRGRWLLLHASCLTGRADAGPGTVAVVIEPAKNSEIAPIIIEAYSLTRRERDVVGELARGATTAEIATSLFLSQHTVRDHIKTVFDKVGVTSRAELVAKLFAEHYAGAAHAGMVHVD